MLQRFIFDERGQDLIEYSLLTALIGIVGILAWTNIETTLSVRYGTWDATVQGLSATTPDPIP